MDLIEPDGSTVPSMSAVARATEIVTTAVLATLAAPLSASA